VHGRMMLLPYLLSLATTSQLWRTPSKKLCEIMKTCSAAKTCKTVEDRVHVCENKFPHSYTTGADHEKDEHNYAKCVVMAEYYKDGETNCKTVRDPFKEGIWSNYLKETKDNPAMKKSLTGDDMCGDTIISNPPWGKPSGIQLNQLMMLGSHDACVSNGKAAYRTQSKSIRCQAIRSPTRIFDTRFKVRGKGKEIWSLHPSSLKPFPDHFAYPLEKHLRDSYKFLDDNPTEFLIWRVKMLENENSEKPDHLKAFAEAVKAFDDKNGPRFLDKSISEAELLQKTTQELQGKLVILAYNKDKSGGEKKFPLFDRDILPNWAAKRVLTGKYSNKNKRSRMLSLQAPKNTDEKNGWQVGDEGDKNENYSVDGQRALHGVWYTLTFTGFDESNIQRNFNRNIKSPEGQQALYADLTSNHNKAETKPAVIWFDFNGELAQDAAVYKFMRKNGGKSSHDEL